MEQKRNNQMVIIGLLAIAILVMSVGFAASAYTERLYLGGEGGQGGAQVTAKAAKWSVHFDTTSYQETTGSVAAASKTIGQTAMNYAVTLTNPGDFYEFTINVVNDGTFDAKLASITLTNSSNDPHIAYSLKYTDDEVPANTGTYTASTNGLTYELDANDVHPVVVRVEYVEATPQLEQDLTVSLFASLNYESVIQG